MSDESVDLAGNVLKTTERAVLFEDHYGEEIWIPRSLIDAGDAVMVGENVVLSVKEWFANKEGLLD